MAKVKVTSRFKILELIDRFVDGTTANAIGNAVADGAKEMIANGQSPVAGYGRFDAYKNRLRYPGKLKAARPVNLNLTGEMLSYFGFRIIGTSIEVGVIGAPREVEDRAKAHQEGTDVMAQRKMVPTDGEEWAQSIMRDIRDRYGTRLADLIRQSNK